MPTPDATAAIRRQLRSPAERSPLCGQWLAVQRRAAEGAGQPPRLPPTTLSRCRLRSAISRLMPLRRGIAAIPPHAADFPPRAGGRAQATIAAMPPKIWRRHPPPSAAAIMPADFAAAARFSRAARAAADCCHRSTCHYSPQAGRLPAIACRFRARLSAWLFTPLRPAAVDARFPGLPLQAAVHEASLLLTSPAERLCRHFRAAPAHKDYAIKVMLFAADFSAASAAACRFVFADVFAHH